MEQGSYVWYREQRAKRGRLAGGVCCRTRSLLQFSPYTAGLLSLLLLPCLATCHALLSLYFGLSLRPDYSELFLFSFTVNCITLFYLVYCTYRCLKKFFYIHIYCLSTIRMLTSLNAGTCYILSTVSWHPTFSFV